MASGIPYPVRRSARARRTRLVVRPEGIEVVVPERASLDSVVAWVEQKRPWVENTVRRLRDAQRATPRATLVDGGRAPCLGRLLELRIALVPGGRSGAQRRGDQVLVRVAHEGEEAVRAALERWYRAEARREVARRLDDACRRAGRSYGRLTIRAQRTRWASCSATGDMSFNWRLLLAPEAILDYVVEHEVAHLDVRDHSPAFRALLASRCPAHREHERWLRRHGPALRL